MDCSFLLSCITFFVYRYDESGWLGILYRKGVDLGWVTLLFLYISVGIPSEPWDEYDRFESLLSHSHHLDKPSLCDLYRRKSLKPTNVSCPSQTPSVWRLSWLGTRELALSPRRRFRTNRRLLSPSLRWNPNSVRLFLQTFVQMTKSKFDTHFPKLSTPNLFPFHFEGYNSELLNLIVKLTYVGNKINLSYTW